MNIFKTHENWSVLETGLKLVFYCFIIVIFAHLFLGEFGHSNLRRPECMSEKRLNELELERKKDSLKLEIQTRTNVRQKILLLNEQVSFKFFWLAPFL